MDGSGWMWANLTGDQLKMLDEAEKTLGAKYLLAYQKKGQGGGRTSMSPVGNLKIASLSESQIECLHGLENGLQAVVIAYQ